MTTAFNMTSENREYSENAVDLADAVYAALRSHETASLSTVPAFNLFAPAANNGLADRRRFRSMRYTFELYSDAAESRAWYHRFLREHNGKRWYARHPGAVTSVIRAPQQQWIRVCHDGCLLAYARVNEASAGEDFPIISDVYVLPRYRRRGHYHWMFRDLVTFARAEGVALAPEKTTRYKRFYESVGFTRLIGVRSMGGGRLDYLVSERLFNERYASLAAVE